MGEYVCSHCRERVSRSFTVRTIIRTCDACGEHGHFLHQSVVDRLTDLPESERPDDWDRMELDERAREAIKRGLIEIR